MWVICQSSMIRLRILIVKLDGHLSRRVASPAPPDKFIDNAANCMLKPLAVPPFLLLCQNLKSKVWGSSFSDDAQPACVQLPESNLLSR